LARLGIDVEATWTKSMSEFIPAQDNEAPGPDLATMTKSFCSEAAGKSRRGRAVARWQRAHDRLPCENLYRAMKQNQIYEGENNYLAILRGGMIV